MSDVPHGNLKAWCVDLNGGSKLYDDEAHSIVGYVWDDNEKEVFTVEELEAMNVGDVLERGERTVTCLMVDETWLRNLPEHDGW